MITRKRVKTYNKILTCLLCEGYLIEATTINTCMHSFCRSCIVKHVKVFENYFCPNCEAEIRLSNLRPDMRLRSLVYKLIPGLYAKEQLKSSEASGRQKTLLNGSAHSLNGKHDRQPFNEACGEDESLSKQYFYDQDEPISLSLEYHMESIFGNSIGLNNIPQVRYLQAPAAFKVIHLKKFLSSKYDLSNLKKSMNIDIIYEGDILLDDFSLMDIAYAYCWEREAPLKLYYRIYKSSKHTSSKLRLIEKAMLRQPYVKLSNELREASKASKHAIEARNATTTKDLEAPRHDLKIIIAKKSNGKSTSSSSSTSRLNKPNGNNGSKVLSDFERLRGEVDNVVQFASASSSDIVSTSEMKTTLSKKTGTVSHHDLKLENKSNNTKKHNSSDSHDYYESSAMSGSGEREKEKSYSASSSEKQQRRESAKHAKNSEKLEKAKASKSSSNLSLTNIPKLKIELPSLKTKITVPKTPTDTYVIASKSPLSSPKCGEAPSLKRVRFDISTKSGCDNADEGANFVDQMEYAERIGLKPVERKVESIILHRKRKKSKHSSREGEHSKRPKLHVSSSLDESLKLKLKIMGGKSCKKSNEEEAPTCNLRAVPSKNADLTSINAQQEERQKKQQKEAEAVVGLENHKYSVSEQKNAKSADQPMVFVPKLVLQKTQSVTTSGDKSDSTVAAQKRNSFVVEQSAKPTTTSPNTVESIKLKVKSFDAISSSDGANQKLMKPPTAKMGSPKQSHISTTFSLSPMRPHSIPASLKLSPISQSSSSDFQMHTQNLKRSLSLGAEKSSPSYLNAYIKPNKAPSFPTDIQYSKIPPLIKSTASFRNFYGSTSCTLASKSQSQSPQPSSKLPNINVKDPMKLFPNACPSVEILKIPQKTFAPSIKLNRQMSLPSSTIPLEKIRKSAQTLVNSQKILPRPAMSLSAMKAPTGFHQSPQCSSQTLNYSGIYQSPINRDLSLERYTLELTHDIAKLDRSLSLEKNFEHWEKRKLQEYSKLNELKNFSLATKNLLNQQQNLSVRTVPNPSAIMMSRNQTSGFRSEAMNSITVKTANMSPQKETVTSTNSEHSDIEEILSKSTIAKASDLPSQKSPVSRVNDKKSIEKLTEYLRLTAAKSKDVKQDDDNNNNNNNGSSNNCDESQANGKSYNLMAKSDKFMNVPSVDVICIDS